MIPQGKWRRTSQDMPIREADSESTIRNWDRLARSYLLTFHRHSRIAPISGLFFIHIPGYSQTIQLRPFVFNDIPGYPFIFAIIFLRLDSLQLKLITDLISNSWFFQSTETSLRFLANLLIFHQHSRFHPRFPRWVLPAVEGKPINAIKTQRR